MVANGEGWGEWQQDWAGPFREREAEPHIDYMTADYANELERKVRQAEGLAALGQAYADYRDRADERRALSEVVISQYPGGPDAWYDDAVKAADAHEAAEDALEAALAAFRAEKGA